MEQGQRDLVLAPNEYAFIQDATKGGINVYVGPHKTSLAGTDKPVRFDYKEKKFIPTKMEACILNFTTAPEGWYAVLKNPAEGDRNPKVGTANNTIEMNIGRKVNIPGPTNFALWPGQMSKVIQGHQLKSNQYLVVRVYDDEAAKENWNTATVKVRTDGEGNEITTEAPEDLAIGKLYIIKGTAISFYIPPTGVEVVEDEHRNYVRDAVTLERLEYCILLDENGEKRYVKGPDVVFPEPTEVFITKDKNRKFRAIELNDNSGIYVKVIANYDDHKAGDELFITGKEQKLYYPRAEHATIKYGDESVQFGMAVPEGEGRYVLNRETGSIDLVKGPIILLPDPRKEVLVRRVLTDNQAKLWYPGNQEALDLNRSLREKDSTGSGFVTTRGGQSRNALGDLSDYATMAEVLQKAGSGMSGDEFQRRQSFTPSKAITLDAKYDGAVAVNVWPGYAVQLVNKRGERNVVQGPMNVLLKYEEDMTSLAMSTGKPKNTDNLFSTVYLKIKGNKVSDIISVETSDMVKCNVKVSIRVNFEGDPNKWFDVDNYVKLLTDHLRSLLKDAVKRITIQDFYANAITIIRNVILGVKEADKPRTMKFEENDMVIYDVEVLDVSVGDRHIAQLLADSQESAVERNLRVVSKNIELETTTKLEAAARKITEERHTTKLFDIEKRLVELDKEYDVDIQREGFLQDLKELEATGKLAKVKHEDERDMIAIARDKFIKEQRLELDKQELVLYGQKLEMQNEAAKIRGEAVSPQLVAALQAFGDKHLMEKLAKSMGTLAIANGSSVTTEFQRLLNNTPLTGSLEKFVSGMLLDKMEE